MTVKKKSTEADVMNEVNRVPMSGESRRAMSLNIYDLQYLVRLQDMSNEAFKQTFNEEFAQSVIKSVSKEVAEVITPIYKKLEELADGQKLIAEDILAIKQRLDVMEDEVKTDKREIASIHKRLDNKRKKIEELECLVMNLQPETIESFRREVHELAPLLLKSVKVNSSWNIGLRIVSGVAIGIILMWFILKYWWVKIF